MADLSILAGPSDPPLAGADEETLAKLRDERELGRDMLLGHAERWRDDFARYEVLAVEKSFALPVTNPASERASRYFDQAGVIDLVVRDRATGLVYVIDHKTSASGMVADLLALLRFDFQASLYPDAWERISGERPAGFIANVLVKRRAPKPPRVIRAKSKADACPCGAPLITDAKTGKPVPHALSRDKSQSTTGALYRAALREHGLSEESYAELLAVFDAAPPERYVREGVSRTPEQVAAWRTELYEASRDIRTGRVYANPRPSECPRCPYLPLCTSDTPEARSLYRVAEIPHEEIDADEIEVRDGKDVLSQSRLKTYYQCRMREKWAYREKLRPITVPRALRFGTGIHECLAQWYRTGGACDIIACWDAWWTLEYTRLTGRMPEGDEKFVVPF